MANLGSNPISAGLHVSVLFCRKTAMILHEADKPERMSVHGLMDADLKESCR